jgi:uncharacterized protein
MLSAKRGSCCGQTTIAALTLRATINPSAPMLYVIYALDAPNSLALRLQARPAHLARLQQLRDQGRLILAGPMPAIDSPDPGPAGFVGSVIVAEFSSLVDAQAFADSDPYVAAGVYQQISVQPFKQVLP